MLWVSANLPGITPFVYCLQLVKRDAIGFQCEKCRISGIPSSFWFSLFFLLTNSSLNHQWPPEQMSDWMNGRMNEWSKGNLVLFLFFSLSSPATNPHSLRLLIRRGRGEEKKKESLIVMLEQWWHLLSFIVCFLFFSIPSLSLSLSLLVASIVRWLLACVVIGLSSLLLFRFTTLSL